MGWKRRCLAIAMAIAFFGCAALEKWGDSQSSRHPPRTPLGLEGCNFRKAREFTGKYCMDCHSSRGSNPLLHKAVLNLKMDTYKDWMEAAGAVPSVLDRAALEAPIMPPSTFHSQPDDSERQFMVDWVKRGSPNTDSGR